MVRLEPRKRHLVSRHGFLRIGKISIERFHVPCNVRLFHCSRIIVAHFRTSLAPEQPCQRRTQHVFRWFHGMAGLTLPEDLSAGGSVATNCLGYFLCLSGRLSALDRARRTLIVNCRWRLRWYS